MNLAWIGNARAAFRAMYGEKRGDAVCGAVIPGVMADFRKVLQAAPAGTTAAETYRLDDKRGDVILTGTPEGVGPLLSGDELEVGFNGLSLKTRVL